MAIFITYFFNNVYFFIDFSAMFFRLIFVFFSRSYLFLFLFPVIIYPFILFLSFSLVGFPLILSIFTYFSIVFFILFYSHLFFLLSPTQHDIRYHNFAFTLPYSYAFPLPISLNSFPFLVLIKKRLHSKTCQASHNSIYR